MKIRISTSKCNGCTLCSKKCPVQAIEMIDKKAQINENCNFCGICISICPQKAIYKSIDDEAIGTVDGEYWVMLEKKPSGEVNSTSFEIISKLHQMHPNKRIVAVLLTNNTTEIPLDALSEVGTDKLLTLRNESFKEYHPTVYTEAITAICKELKPVLFLFPATEMGRDLAPRIATELHTGLTADCTELSFDENNGLLIQTRPAWDGNLMASIICPVHRPQMATIRPHVFQIEKNDPKQCLNEVIETPINTGIQDVVIKRSTVASSYPDLEKQTIVFGVGRGIGTKENVEEIFALAKSVKAGIGCSRPIVDKGWLPHDVQIGMSGTSIAPKVYIALGISGSVQHLVGMQSSEYIIAVNKDENAPIFQHAHLSLVGDIKKMLPAIKEIIDKKRKENE